MKLLPKLRLGRAASAGLLERLKKARQRGADRRRRARQQAAEESSVRIVSCGGQPCAMGLFWRSRPPPPLSGPPLALTWRGMHATADDSLLAGLPPLAAAIAATAGISPEEPSWEGATILAVDAPTENFWWAVVLVNAVPAAAGELVFNDRDTLISWAQEECSGSDINRMVAVGDFYKEIHAGTQVIRLSDVDAIRPDAELPLFRIRPLPRLVRLLGSLVLILALAFAGWRAWSMLTTPQAALKVDVLVPWEQPLEQFVTRCNGELRKFWPRPPGWIIHSAGCVASGMFDEIIPNSAWPNAGTAYHSFRLQQDHNGPLARAVAELLYDDWEGLAKVSDRTILLQRRFPLERKLAGPPASPDVDRLRSTVETHFLGLADSVSHDGDWITVASSAAISTLLSRLIELDQQTPLSVRHLSRDQAGVRMEILPRQRILLPPP